MGNGSQAFHPAGQGGQGSGGQGSGGRNTGALFFPVQHHELIHASEHANNHTSEHANNHASEHANKQASEHANKQASEHANNHASEHANNHASEHANKHASEHVNKHASEHANKHASEHANKHASEHANKQAKITGPSPSFPQTIIRGSGELRLISEAFSVERVLPPGPAVSPHPSWAVGLQVQCEGSGVRGQGSAPGCTESFFSGTQPPKTATVFLHLCGRGV